MNDVIMVVGNLTETYAIASQLKVGVVMNLKDDN